MTFTRYNRAVLAQLEMEESLRALLNRVEAVIRAYRDAGEHGRAEAAREASRAMSDALCALHEFDEERALAFEEECP